MSWKQTIQEIWEEQESLKEQGIRKEGNRYIKTMPSGEEVICGGGSMSRSELKTSFVLQSNVRSFFGRHPIGNVGFLTLTFPPSVVTPKEANRRFNNFNSRYLRLHSLEWIKVTEPHKDKRPHFHLLVAFPFDIRAGFDFETFQAAQQERIEHGPTKQEEILRRSYVMQAAPALRDQWKGIREACRAHRIGRSELLPIRKVGEAATKYVGKYIEKGSVARVGAWKGARLTSYSQGFPRVANCRFSWVGASTFRRYAQAVAEFHLVSEERMSDVFGPKWAYKLLLAESNGLDASEAARFLVESSLNVGRLCASTP